MNDILPQEYRDPNRILDKKGLKKLLTDIATNHPEKYPELMVKVAGHSARFVDLDKEEQDEIIGRTLQRYN